MIRDVWLCDPWEGSGRCWCDGEGHERDDAHGYDDEGENGAGGGDGNDADDDGYNDADAGGMNDDVHGGGTDGGRWHANTHEAHDGCADGDEEGSGYVGDGVCWPMGGGGCRGGRCNE